MYLGTYLKVSSRLYTMLLYNSTNTYQNPHEEVILKFLVFKDLDYLERIWGSGDCIERF